MGSKKDECVGIDYLFTPFYHSFRKDEGTDSVLKIMFRSVTSLLGLRQIQYRPHFVRVQ